MLGNKSILGFVVRLLCFVPQALDPPRCKQYPLCDAQGLRMALKCAHFFWFQRSLAPKQIEHYISASGLHIQLCPIP